MPRLRTLLLALVAILLFSSSLRCSAQSNSRVITRARVIGNDTIPHVRLNEVVVLAKRLHMSKQQKAKWNRFIYNVKKALPYARLVSSELKIIDDSLALISDEKRRKAFIDAKEQELFAKYEQPLKHLTVSQGRILIKLIDRETGQTSYELIRLLKGRFKAFWWQGVARVFGSSLKSEYDPEGDDRAIETAVLLIDMGVY